jgi:type VI secretion system protein ImpJ
MSRFRKIIWNEGMLLSPQHFQQWDNYYEGLLNARLGTLVAYEWGVLDLQISRESVRNGKLELERCRAVLPDGLMINVPQTDAAPAPRAIADHFAFDAEGLDVYLAIPAKRAGAANYQMNGGAPDPRFRYWQEAERVPDEITGRGEQQIAFARNNLRLLFGDESRDGYSTIKIAELARATTGHIVLSDHYVPPLLNVAASLWLMDLLHELVEILVTKSSSLGEQRRRRGTALAAFTTSEVATFWLLHTVNAAIPVLTHLFRTHLVHPERLYVEMAALAGKLMTFVPDRHPKDIVRYEHTQLYETFSRLGAELRFLLETVIPTRCVQIPLEKDRESLYVGRVEDKQLLDDAEFYLGVSAQIPEVQLIERVPRVVKMASRDTIDIIIASAMHGVPLSHASPPPAPIPVRPRFHYFALDRQGVHWERIRGSKSLAVYVPEELLDETVELYAVKP